MKNKFLLLVSVGFALFSMFFGSGNLVFPLQVGVESGGEVFAASLGVLITCVIFPLLGMFGIALYNGSVEAFFSLLGKRGTLLFSLVALGLMGPFGVLARCLTVIHGASVLLFPWLTLSATSFGICLVTYLLAVNKSRIVHVVGAWLTPFLLASIAAIVFFALHEASSQSMTSDALGAFKTGFFTGYQTMDLVAAFFFSGFVLAQLKSEGHTTSFFIKASCIAAGLLYSVYLALVTLGWLYAPLLANVPAQEMFGRVALASLGSFGAPLVAIAVVLACLTTAIALASLFAEFLNVKVFSRRLGEKRSLMATLVIAFFVSNLEFSGIANFLGPILEAAYPALIAVTLFNIYRAKSMRVVQ